MSEGLFNTASKPSGFNLIKINDNSPRTNIGTGEPDYFRVRNLSPSNKVDLYGGVGTDIVDLNNIGNLNSSDRGIINIALGAGGNNDGTSEINNIKVGDNVFNTTLKINGNFSRDQIELQGNPED
jgi:hypothetical protein